MSTPDLKEQQLLIAERLQIKWLEHMEYLFEVKEITSTDLATLARLLMSNGWNLDPARLPKGLQDKLQGWSPPAFDEAADNEEFGGLKAVR